MEKAAILATSALLFLSNSVIADSVKEQATNTAAETVTSSTIMEQITNEITTSALTTNGAAYMVLAGGVLASLYLVKNVNKKRLSNEESPAPSWGNKKIKRSNSSVRRENLPHLGELNIYFGSQTGTGEGFAKVLKAEAKKKGFDPRVIDLEDFNPDTFLECEKNIFIMSTYGEGDPTDSAAEFYDYIKNDSKQLDCNYLADANFKYCVFGLGNSIYEHFNVVSKRTDEFLEQLGGERVRERGIGDDNNNLEEDFETWRENLWDHFISKEETNRIERAISMSQEAGEASESEDDDIPFEVVFLPKETSTNIKQVPEDDHINASTRHYFSCEESLICGTKELRNPVDKGSTIQVEFNIKDLKTVTYKTADNLAVLPDNDYRLVEGIAKTFDYELDAVFKLHYNQGEKEIFPTPCTVRNLLTRYCDISSIPKKATLQGFVKYCTDAEEASRLKHLCSKEGKEEYEKFVTRGTKSLFEMITIHFPSIKMPLNKFIQLVPRLQPRYYTISSSSNVYPDNIHATVAVVVDELSDERVHRGVCSNHLAHLQVGQKCRIFVRPSTFRLPENPETPVLMIGPGTGIAPMRALLQERRYQKEMLKKNVGPNVLYFGCRERALDFIYEEELLQFTKDGTLTDLQLAFSRDQAQKVYVQHLLAKEENAEKFWNYLDKDGGYIYVCGATNMGADVLNTIQNIIQIKGNMSNEKARAYITDLQLAGRYIQELWAGA